MGKRGDEKLSEGVMTESMDLRTEGFNEFKKILLAKSNSQTLAQKRKVELAALRFKMEDFLNSKEGSLQVGTLLKYILKEIHIPQNKFAEYLGLRPSNFAKLLIGERPISSEMALKLGQIFNVDPLLWLYVQSKSEMQKLTKRSVNSTHSLEDLLHE